MATMYTHSKNNQARTKEEMDTSDRNVTGPRHSLEKNPADKEQGETDEGGGVGATRKERKTSESDPSNNGNIPNGAKASTEKKITATSDDEEGDEPENTTAVQQRGAGSSSKELMSDNIFVIPAWPPKTPHNVMQRHVTKYTKTDVEQLCQSPDQTMGFIRFKKAIQASGIRVWQNRTSKQATLNAHRVDLVNFPRNTAKEHECIWIWLSDLPYPSSTENNTFLDLLLDKYSKSDVEPRFVLSAGYGKEALVLILEDEESYIVQSLQSGKLELEKTILGIVPLEGIQPKQRYQCKGDDTKQAKDVVRPKQRCPAKDTTDKRESGSVQQPLAEMTKPPRHKTYGQPTEDKRPTSHPAKVDDEDSAGISLDKKAQLSAVASLPSNKFDGRNQKALSNLKSKQIQSLPMKPSVKPSIPLPLHHCRLLASVPEEIDDITKRFQVGIKVQLLDDSSGLLISGAAADQYYTFIKRRVDSLLTTVQDVFHEDARPGLATLLQNESFNDILRRQESRYNCVIRVEQKTPTQKTNKGSKGASKQHEHGETLLYEKNKMSLMVKKGDITKCVADVLVNTVVSNELKSGGTVAKAFLKAGGPNLQWMYDDELRAKNCTKTAYPILITLTSGNLNCLKVFHTKIQAWKQGSGKSLEEMIHMCLEKADRYRASTIAFPMIGSGYLKFPQQEVALCFKKAIDRASDHIQGLKIMIMAFDQNAEDQMVQSFKDIDAGYGSTGEEHWWDEHANVFVFNISTIAKSGTAQPLQALRNILDQQILEETDIYLPEADSAYKIDLQQKYHDCLGIKYDPKQQTLKLIGLKDIVEKIKTDLVLQYGKYPSVKMSSVSPKNYSTGQSGYSQSQGYSKQHSDPEKDYLFKLAQEQPDIPDYWKSSKSGGMVSSLVQWAGYGTYQLTDLNVKNCHAVTTLMQRTWKGQIPGKSSKKYNLDIVGVQRVENPSLWLEYEKNRKALVKEAAYDRIGTIEKTEAKEKVLTTTLNIPELDALLVHQVNEVFLFHGTSDIAALNIAKTGFVVDLTSGNSQFGYGLYFAESTTKSDQYTDDVSGERCMIVTRVLLGRTAVYTKPRVYEGPPCNDPHCLKPNCYRHKTTMDSIIGIGRDWGRKEATPLAFREYIIFDKHRCYPEFIVTYNRK